MRMPRAGVLVAVAASVWAASGGTAAAQSPCDVIVQASNAVTQAQLAFTQQAYSDGTITPEEAAQAELFSQRIAKITADLGTCIATGVVPPGYAPLQPPPDTVPPAPPNTFKVEIGRWHIGDRTFRLVWDTADPTAAPKLTVYKLTQGITTAACRKPKGKPKKGARRCQLKTAVGTISPPAGATSIKFKGKVGRRKLGPGKYLFEITLTDQAGNVSKPKTARLTILPRKQKH